MEIAASLPSIPAIVMLCVILFGMIAWMAYEAQIFLASRRNITDMANSENRKRDERIAQQRNRLNTISPQPMVRRPV